MVRASHRCIHTMSSRGCRTSDLRSLDTLRQVPSADQRRFRLQTVFQFPSGPGIPRCAIQSNIPVSAPFRGWSNSGMSIPDSRSPSLFNRNAYHEAKPIIGAVSHRPVCAPSRRFGEVTTTRSGHVRSGRSRIRTSVKDSRPSEDQASYRMGDRHRILKALKFGAEAAESAAPLH